MQVIILYPSARRVEGLVQSVGRHVIRVVPRQSAAAGVRAGSFRAAEEAAGTVARWL
jgi:hypothetical protein